MAAKEAKFAEPGSKPPKAKLRVIDGVQVYARIDKDGKPSIVDAIDQDEAKIRNLADQLFRRGFGVMRQRKPRAGKVFYLLKALWPGPDEPPKNPFGPASRSGQHAAAPP